MADGDRARPVFHCLVRLRLPDRPGALGAVASRIGAVGGDVVGIDILQHDPGVVVDEIGVSLAGENLVDLLCDEILEVDGVSIESLRPVAGALPDWPAELLDMATDLFEQTTRTSVLEHLVTGVRRRLAAELVAVLETGTCRLVTSDGDFPDDRAGWWPDRRTAGPVRSEPPPGDRERPVAGPAQTTAELSHAGLTLVVRRAEPVLRSRERQRLSIVAGLADRRWSELS